MNDSEKKSSNNLSNCVKNFNKAPHNKNETMRKNSLYFYPRHALCANSMV